MKFIFTDMHIRQKKPLETLLQYYFGKLYKECNNDSKRTLKHIVYECLSFPSEEGFYFPNMDHESIYFSMKREERLDSFELFGLIKCSFEYYKFEDSNNDNFRVEAYVNDKLSFAIDVVKPNKKMKTVIRDKIEDIIHFYDSSVKRFEKDLKNTKLPL